MISHVQAKWVFICPVTCSALPTPVGSLWSWVGASCDQSRNSFSASATGTPTT